MKNFFKKLSFVLAIAMVLTSIAPATASAAEVVPAKKVNVKVDGEKVDTINLTVGETETVKIGLPVKKAYAGQKSTFKTAAVAEGTAVEVVRVGNRTYELTAVEAGEATITFGAAKTKKLANAGEFKVSKEVKVVVETNATLAVEATGASELTVTLTSADVKATDIVVKRGTTTVNATAVIDGTTAVVTTDAKMIAGTYTVTVGELSASCDVEEQYVKEIVIENEGGFVPVCSYDGGTDNAVKVRYDVLDQYGDSVRKSSTIKWSSSLNRDFDSVNDGYVIFAKATGDNDALTYNSSVYITAVYSKGTNVCTKSAEVKVGLEAKLDTIEFGGIVKAGTNSFTSLPVGFVADRYLLAFAAKDQYGNTIDMASDFNLADVSFTSKAPLTLSVSKTHRETAVPQRVITIGGETYYTVYVQPELQTNKGGSVEINAISGKTGTMSTYTIDMTEDQILTDFFVEAPEGIVSEGRTITLNFTALDQFGEKITSYRVLNGKVDITAAHGSVTIKEQDNGTAVVEYTAPGTGATDEIDLYETLTTVVQGSGGFDSINFYVREQARPAAISSVGGATALLESGYTTIYAIYQNPWTPYFVYADQYGRVLDGAATDGSLADIKYWFGDGDGIGVLADTTGVSDRLYVVADGASTPAANTIVTNGAITVGARPHQSKDTAVEMVKFALYGYDSNARAKEVGGSAKKVNYSVYDISKVTSFELANVKDYIFAGNDEVAVDDDHKTIVKVNGYTVDGTKVSVPHYYNGDYNYYTLSVENILGYTATASDAAIDGRELYFNGISGETAFKTPNVYGDLYRDEKITLKVVINDVNNGGQKDVLTKTLVLGGYSPVATTFVPGWGQYLGYVVNGLTMLDYELHGYVQTALTFDGENYMDQFNLGGRMYDHVEDQYGIAIEEPTVDVTITKVVENEAGQDKFDFAIRGNGTSTPEIIGAEIGDTFTLTFSVAGTPAVYTVDVVVGADFTSEFNGSTPSVMY